MQQEPSPFARCKGISAKDAARLLNIDLKERGARSWALCPFHHEKNPSLMFDDKGRWHCFGCGRGGDAVAFVSEHLKLSSLKAARWLISEMRGTLPPERPTPLRPALALKKLLEAWYFEQLAQAYAQVKAAEDARDQAEKDALARGLSPEEVWDDEAFSEASIRASRTRMRFDLMDFNDPGDLAKAYAEENGMGWK